VPAFWVKLGANDLNYVDVPLNSIHSRNASGIKQTSWRRYVLGVLLLYMLICIVFSGLHNSLWCGGMLDCEVAKLAHIVSLV